MKEKEKMNDRERKTKRKKERERERERRPSFYNCRYDLQTGHIFPPPPRRSIPFKHWRKKSEIKPCDY